MSAPAKPSHARCRTCGEVMLWATTANGKTVPITPKPDAEGDVVVVRGADRLILALWLNSANVKARARGAGVELHRIHRDVCTGRKRVVRDD